jgi:hypothetical protein
MGLKTGLALTKQQAAERGPDCSGDPLHPVGKESEPLGVGNFGSTTPVAGHSADHSEPS